MVKRARPKTGRAPHLAFSALSAKKAMITQLQRRVRHGLAWTSLTIATRAKTKSTEQLTTSVRAATTGITSPRLVYASPTYASALMGPAQQAQTAPTMGMLSAQVAPPAGDRTHRPDAQVANPATMGPRVRNGLALTAAAQVVLDARS
jgi:hypothetical protein